MRFHLNLHSTAMLDAGALSKLKRQLDTEKIPAIDQYAFDSWPDAYQWAFLQASLLWAADMMTESETGDFVNRLLCHAFKNRECKLESWSDVYNWAFKQYMALRKAARISSVASEKIMRNVMNHLIHNPWYKRPAFKA